MVAAPRAAGGRPRRARGLPVDETFADQVEENEGFFDDVPSTAALYLDPDGTPRDVGTTLRNPDLARAYERIGRHGSKGFYEGPIARAIVAAVRRPPVAADADHAWRPGLLTRGDVHDYRSIERPPVVGRFRGLDVVGVGPSSSGGTAVAEVLNILDGLALDAGDRTRALHLLLEAERLAYADRGAFLADPAYADVPLAGLLSPTLRRRAPRPDRPGARGDEPRRAGRPLRRPGLARTPGGRRGRPRGARARRPTSWSPTPRARCVSYTFTIESTGGNGIVVPGWGFLLNNELTDFDFDAPGAANEPEGGKRPRSSISPTIVLRDGAPLLAIGSPGGSTIPPTVLQVLVDHLALGASLPDAIAAPRVAERNRPLATAEPAFLTSPEGAALADPAGYGHRFDPEADDPIGAVTAIRWLDDGRTLAAAEPERRGGGSAAVVAP